jgi:hypothetical protein
MHTLLINCLRAEYIATLNSSYKENVFPMKYITFAPCEVIRNPTFVGLGIRNPEFWNPESRQWNPESK